MRAIPTMSAANIPKASGNIGVAHSILLPSEAKLRNGKVMEMSGRNVELAETSRYYHKPVQFRKRDGRVAARSWFGAPPVGKRKKGASFPNWMWNADLVRAIS